MINQRKAIKNPTNPFKDIKDLKREVTSYINAHKAFIHNQAKRISDYFEMCCFNYIIRYYENSGYTVTIENLINKKYKYKLTASGYPQNFSHFKVIKQINENGKPRDYEYEIHHNLPVQSAHQSDIFTTPDVAVINANSIIEDNKYYQNRMKYYYSSNMNAQTFCEAKHFSPFPELIFSFVGTVNELRTDIMTRTEKQSKPSHIAPSLMISGKGNQHTERIKESLQNRYSINIIFDLFAGGVKTFSKKNIGVLQKVGHR